MSMEFAVGSGERLFVRSQAVAVCFPPGRLSAQAATAWRRAAALGAVCLVKARVVFGVIGDERGIRLERNMFHGTCFGRRLARVARSAV